MPASATFRVVADGPAGGAPEVELAEDQITVYAWPGAAISVFDGERKVTFASLRARLPVLR